MVIQLRIITVTALRSTTTRVIQVEQAQAGARGRPLVATITNASGAAVRAGQDTRPPLAVKNPLPPMESAAVAAGRGAGQADRRPDPATDPLRGGPDPPPSSITTSSQRSSSPRLRRITLSTITPLRRRRRGSTLVQLRGQRVPPLTATITNTTHRHHRPRRQAALAAGITTRSMVVAASRMP